MTATGQCVVRGEFIEAPNRRLFAVYYAPRENCFNRKVILYVPPFAEEMNRSRRMAALQARAFASLGLGTLLLDLFGTGDSTGDFRDARWELWLEDISVAADWLENRGAVVTCLWGLRLGALLACAAAAASRKRFNRLLLWQPVTDGALHLTQFLRIRIAAGISLSGAGEKIEQLRAQLADGRPVEVAGYELSPELARTLVDLRTSELALVPGTNCDWLEIGTEATDRLLPAGQRVVEHWRRAGITSSSRTVAGDPFWMLQETTLAPALIAATTDLFPSCQS